MSNVINLFGEKHLNDIGNVIINALINKVKTTDYSTTLLDDVIVEMMKKQPIDESLKYLIGKVVALIETRWIKYFKLLKVEMNAYTVSIVMLKNGCISIDFKHHAMDDNFATLTMMLMGEEIISALSDDITKNVSEESKISITKTVTHAIPKKVVDNIVSEFIEDGTLLGSIMNFEIGENSYYLRYADNYKKEVTVWSLEINKKYFNIEIN